MPNKPFVVTVSQLSTKLDFMMRSEKTFADICVKGEVSNLSFYEQKGYTYFTLKDEGALLKAVIFDRGAKLPDGGLHDGTAVIARGSVKYYAKGGYCQIVVAEVTEVGTGTFSEEFDRLRKRLSDEGLFAQKRPVPSMPSKICLITASDKDAVKDMTTNIKRRFPPVEIVIVPAIVQGADAPASLVKAIGKANETDADLIIIGRGGGSAEDLSAFNSEHLVRALYASRIPTISAVGHENDYSLCDFAADVRASTPSTAAELAVPDASALLAQAESVLAGIAAALDRLTERKNAEINVLEASIKANSPYRRLDLIEQRFGSELDKLRIRVRHMTDERTRSCEYAYSQVRTKASSLVGAKERSFLHTAGMIEALNPLAVLLRGYSITYSGGKALKSADGVSSGDKLRIKLADGIVNAVAESTEKD